MWDQTIVSFFKKDCQPLSTVENEGLEELLQALEHHMFFQTERFVWKLFKVLVDIFNLFNL